MMKKILRVLLVFTFVMVSIFFLSSELANSSRDSEILTENISDTTVFELKKGDILVRPNWEKLPWSCSVPNGRRYGHVALVTEDGSGRTVDEALIKARVIEALFFDQHTRKFQFARKDQIRESSAITSFGKKFKGIRFRLRAGLSEDQTNKIIGFLKNQLDGGYNILSTKKKFAFKSDRDAALLKINNSSWNCATLIWESFYLSTDMNIDANGGIFIYPSDIIASRYFDLPGGRISF